MTSTRRLLAPPLVAATALLAIVVPAALGAQTTASRPLSATAVAASAAVTTTGPTGATQTLSATVTDLPHRFAAGEPLRDLRVADDRRSPAPSRWRSTSSSRSARRTAVGFAAGQRPGFGAWVSSQPGVGIFTYNHEVTALPAPAAFRVLGARALDRSPPPRDARARRSSPRSACSRCSRPTSRSAGSRARPGRRPPRRPTASWCATTAPPRRDRFRSR